MTTPSEMILTSELRPPISGLRYVTGTGTVYSINMAKRRTLNRKRNYNRKSTDCADSRLLDPDTNLIDKEQETFWWNNLQENTVPLNSLIHDANETAKQLRVDSRIDLGDEGTSEWWKILDRSNSERSASNSKINFSKAIIKANILQTSTSESEKELDIRKKKVQLKATSNRKNTGNAFLNALNDSKVSETKRKKNVVQMPENRVSFNSKSTRETTLKKPIHTDAILTDDGPSTSKIVKREIRSDDLRDSTSTRASTSSPAKKTHLTRLRKLSETPKSNQDVELSERSINRNVDIEEVDCADKLKSSKGLRKIDDFFKIKQASTTTDEQSKERTQIFDTEKMKKITTELERIKNREMSAMKTVATDKKVSALKTNQSNKKPIILEQTTKKKPPAKPTKVVDKAFLVNGKVYKAPRLPRPKRWATDRLYKFLWKRMEPKYKLATRVKSEKFVQELAQVVSFIERRKNYESYKTELKALMKEMARLKLINTRKDFHHFCQDFLPYEFRIKVVPMILPGNEMNIPFDPATLNIPLLDTADNTV